MKYGIILGSPTLAELLQTAVRAEAAGFESVWTTEFFNSHGLVRLGAVAGVTDRVKLGTAISYIFMRSPMLAASAAMDIDELSGGRMILGLGSGTKRMNEDWYSMSFDGAPAPRFEDAIGLIRAAFAAQHGGGLHYSGPHYSVKIPLYSRPNAAREQIPVCLAAVNKGMIRAAARTGDGLIGHPVFTRDWIKNTVNPALQGSKCKLYPYVMTSIADSTEQARAEAKAQIGFYYTTRLYHSILEPLGWVGHGENCANAFRKGDFKSVADAVTDEMVDEIALTGTPDAVRDQLKQWDGLADEVILYPPSIGIAPGRVQENLDAMIETFASRT